MPSQPVRVYQDKSHVKRPTVATFIHRKREPGTHAHTKGQNINSSSEQLLVK